MSDLLMAYATTPVLVPWLGLLVVFVPWVAQVACARTECRA